MLPHNVWEILNLISLFRTKHSVGYMFAQKQTDACKRKIFLFFWVGPFGVVWMVKFLKFQQ